MLFFAALRLLRSFWAHPGAFWPVLSAKWTQNGAKNNKNKSEIWPPVDPMFFQFLGHFGDQIGLQTPTCIVAPDFRDAKEASKTAKKHENVFKISF